MRAPKKEKPPRITEKAWSAQFKNLFEMLGWKGYHTFNSMRSAPGFPDWTLYNLSQKRVIFVELKAEDGTLSDRQRVWVDALKHCGQEVYVWKPSDFELAARILAKRAA